MINEPGMKKLITRAEQPGGSALGLAMKNRQMEVLTGGDILNLITLGMYTTPLTIYREYIQNAADSIASSGMPDNGKVEIMINPGELCLTIRDNGPGLSYVHAKQDLITIAKSRKRIQHHRGFRGIGRLAGLAFSDKITFLTRCENDSFVTSVAWNGGIFRNGISNKLSVEEIISRCVTIEKIEGSDYPLHFFEVHLSGISRYAAASILNKNIVREYIAEVCPVAFTSDSCYSVHIKQLTEPPAPLALDIYLNDGSPSITRPHGDIIHLSADREDKFVEFEKISIPALDGKGDAAVGWIAHSSYLGALPKKPAIRCVRARIGNIQIGDETIFDHLFTENRFNRWCVAEIHILDSRLAPNGRRDYFESNPHLRNLENHLSAMCRSLEKRCRNASKQRNRQHRLQSGLDNLEKAYSLAAAGYLTNHKAEQLVYKILPDISNLKKEYQVSGNSLEDSSRLEALEKKIINFKANPEPCSFSKISQEEASVYKNIFAVLAEISPSPQAAKDTIESILERVNDRE